jgi:hypothetical protein
MRWLEATVMTAGRERRRGGRACMLERPRDVDSHPEQLELLVHRGCSTAGQPMQVGRPRRLCRECGAGHSQLSARAAPALKRLDLPDTIFRIVMQVTRKSEKRVRYALVSCLYGDDATWRRAT